MGVGQAYRTYGQETFIVISRALTVSALATSNCPGNCTPRLSSITQLSRPARVDWFDPLGKRKRASFHQLEQNPKVRSGSFARIAGGPELQREMLQVLSQHPEAQNELIVQMARSLRIRG
jgi:hypothetical protein